MLRLSLSFVWVAFLLCVCVGGISCVCGGGLSLEGLGPTVKSLGGNDLGLHLHGSNTSYAWRPMLEERGAPQTRELLFLLLCTLR